MRKNFFSKYFLFKLNLLHLLQGTYKGQFTIYVMSFRIWEDGGRKDYKQAVAEMDQA